MRKQRAPAAHGAVRFADSKWPIRRGLRLHAKPFESPTRSPQGLRFSPQAQNKKAAPEGGFSILAERGGFEPPIGYEPIHAFQACDLNHSSISPGFGFARSEAADYSKKISGLARFWVGETAEC